MKLSAQTDMFDAPKESDVVDPTTLRLPPRPIEPALDRRFEDSIRRVGVVSPVLVTLDADGTRTVVGGVRRVLAAEKLGQNVPVHTVFGSPLELAILAFTEQENRNKRSAVEHAWQVQTVVSAAAAENVNTTRRWLEKELGMSTGTAHKWMTIAEKLPPSRIVQLAELAEVDAEHILSLSGRKVYDLAITANDADAIKMLHELFVEKNEPLEQPESILAFLQRMLRTVAEWIRSALSRVPSR